MSHDPDGPPSPSSGLYGFDLPRESARVVVLPLPFEATVSFRAGTAQGPEAIRRASHQLDLWDPDFGDVSAAGICLLPPPDGVAEASARVRPLAEGVIEAVEAGRDPSHADLAAVEDAGAAVREHARRFVSAELEAGRLPALVGGDHSVPQGGIEAAYAAGPLTVLHLDAHADLRSAYEGFHYSHASIMHNLLSPDHPDLRLLQVGLRDLSEEERGRIESDDRVEAVFDHELREARLRGAAGEVLDAIAAKLSGRVWLSFDIDGLDPALCPGTGTPVPGGLSWDEICGLLARVSRAGCTIVGLDLVEVGPDEWDGAVGARLLYKMIGAALRP
jgi:agmatinase